LEGGATGKGRPDRRGRRRRMDRPAGLAVPSHIRIGWEAEPLSTMPIRSLVHYICNRKEGH
jgi:hypothetical protein